MAVQILEGHFNGHKFCGKWFTLGQMRIYLVHLWVWKQPTKYSILLVGMLWVILSISEISSLELLPRLVRKCIPATRDIHFRMVVSIGWFGILYETCLLKVVWPNIHLQLNWFGVPGCCVCLLRRFGYTCKFYIILSGKLTCPLKINGWKMYSLLEQSFFRGHVSFLGCTSLLKIDDWKYVASFWGRLAHFDMNL